MNLPAENPEMEISVEHSLRSNEMVCLGGEEEFDRIMNGDFGAFNRSDCALRYNEIFRWAWESWRAAVGNQIGRTYRNAIDLMNIGARENGKNLFIEFVSVFLFFFLSFFKRIWFFSICIRLR